MARLAPFTARNTIAWFDVTLSAATFALEPVPMPVLGNLGVTSGPEFFEVSYIFSLRTLRVTLDTSGTILRHRPIEGPTTCR